MTFTKCEEKYKEDQFFIFKAKERNKSKEWHYCGSKSFIFLCVGYVLQVLLGLKIIINYVICVSGTPRDILDTIGDQEVSIASKDSSCIGMHSQLYMWPSANFPLLLVLDIRMNSCFADIKMVMHQEGKQLSSTQLEQNYQDWVIKMHDEEMFENWLCFPFFSWFVLFNKSCETGSANYLSMLLEFVNLNQNLFSLLKYNLEHKASLSCWSTSSYL